MVKNNSKKVKKVEYIPKNLKEVNYTSIKWSKIILKHFQKPLDDPSRSKKINLNTKIESSSVGILINTIARNSVYYNDLKFHNQLNAINVIMFNAWKNPELLIKFVKAMKLIKLQRGNVITERKAWCVTCEEFIEQSIMVVTIEDNKTYYSCQECTKNHDWESAILIIETSE